MLGTQQRSQRATRSSPDKTGNRVRGVEGGGRLALGVVSESCPSAAPAPARAVYVRQLRNNSERSTRGGVGDVD